MRRNRGFTLVELMTATAVLGVLVGVGAPALSALTRNLQATAALHSLTSSLALARVEAVRRNRAVTVCPSEDGRSCSRGTAWDTGWLVFVDDDRNGQVDVGPIIHSVEPPGGHMRIRATAGRRHVRFLPSGWASGTNVSMRLCGAGQEGWLGSVVVNNAGRTRTDRPVASAPPCPFD